MSERITRRDLEAVVSRINRALGQVDAAYTRGEDGKLHGNVGSFCIDGAYGGWELHRIMNDGGGVTTPLGSTGHVPARELYGLMHAFLRGVEAGSMLHEPVEGAS